MKEYVKPDNIKEFPEKKIGDFLYTCEDLDFDVGEHIIISTDSSGHCLVVSDEGESCYVGWAVDFHYATAIEAELAQAKSDIEYHEERLKIAMSVIGKHKESMPSSLRYDQN